MMFKQFDHEWMVEGETYFLYIPKYPTHKIELIYLGLSEIKGSLIFKIPEFSSYPMPHGWRLFDEGNHKDVARFSVRYLEGNIYIEDHKISDMTI